MSTQTLPIESGPQIITQGFGAIPARCKTILSVHFEPKDIKFFHSQGRNFHLAAGSKERPALLRVYDSQQFIPDENAMRETDKPPRIPMPVLVEAIVADCLRAWQRSGLNILQQFPAGIIAIEGDSHTREELATAWGMETRLCQALVEEADRFQRSGEGEVTEMHRGALKHLGSEDREWYHRVDPMTTKVSIVSGKRIPMAAMVDAGTDLLEFYVGKDVDPATVGDAHCAAFLKNNPNVRKRIEEKLGIAKK